jgi:endonuclease/exonuclease/phosphatase (EEP) superfamily protein YafD
MTYRLFQGSGIALALLCFVIAGLGEAGRYWIAFDILNHFRPLSAVLGLASLCLILIAVRPLSRAAIPLALCAFALAWQASYLSGEIQPASFDARASQPGHSVKIMTYNMLKDSTNVSDLIAFVESRKPDIVSLQEVGLGGREAVERLKSIYPYFEVEHRQLALFSRYPITVLDVSKAKSASDSRLEPTRIIAEIAMPDGKPLRFINVHLGWPAPARRFQRRELDWLIGMMAGAGHARTILAGDFNSTPYSHEFRRFEAAIPLKRATIGLPSYPTPHAVGSMPVAIPFAFLPIDHVFAGDGLTVDAVERGPFLGSDHYPVLATLRLE